MHSFALLLKKGIKKIRHFLIRYDLDQLLCFGYSSSIPQRRLAVGYLSYIFIGMILLSLPIAHKQEISAVDNLFTVTSALSTTGLGTVDIGTSYSLFGQVIILLLIQFGGLGYMTLSSFILYQLTHHFMRIKKGVMHTSFSIPVELQMSSIIKGIIYFSIILETSGSIILYYLFKQAGVEQPLWNGIFHAVSAFCTAGFSLLPDNLMRFGTNWPVCMVIAALSYAGAMGFIVMVDVAKKLTRKGHKITFTTQMIIIITTLITVAGTLQLFFFEPSFVQYDTADRILVSFFQTMSAMTTVGFNSVSLSPFILSSLLTVMLAMFVGASPSGTGGGVKSTTVSIVFAFVSCKLSEQRNVTLFSHKLPTYRVDTALTNLIFYGFILGTAIYFLTFTETLPFEQIAFEACSALGTVGLSTGVTASFSVVGKLILTLLMYIGRLGVLAFGTSMLIRMSNKERMMGADSDCDLAV